MNGRNLDSQAAEARAAYIGKRDRSGYRAGTGAVSQKERREGAEGARVGALVRERQEAREIIELAESVSAATGRPVDEAAEYGDRRPDGSRRTLAEAREILAEAERRARVAGRPAGRYSWQPDPERMTDRELLAIGTAAASATAAAINRKAARSARLSDDDYAELRAWLLAEAAEKGAPRWRAILTDGEAATAARALSGADLATLRGRWIGYLILRGRTWRQERHERMMAEGAEQEGAEGADIGAETGAAGATVEAVAARLEAAGKPLGLAERQALIHALTGLSRRELAERFDVTPESLKKNLGRGRASLDTRWLTARKARADLAAAAEAALQSEGGAAGNAGRECARWLGMAEAAGWEYIADTWRALMGATAAENGARAIIRPDWRMAADEAPVIARPLAS